MKQVLYLFLLFSYSSFAGFAVNSPDSIWPNGEIPYEFAPNLSESIKQKVIKAMDEWSTKTVIQFIPRRSEQTYLYIKESTGNFNCTADLGYVQNKIRYASLNNNCTYQTILHELAHVIGLDHEHQRPDRDNYVTLNHSLARQLISDPKDLEKTFAIRNTNRKIFGSYDVKSITHYNYGLFKNIQDQPNPKTISPNDIETVNELYQTK